jgi:biopolymer transport protein ExbB/TolQ
MVERWLYYMRTRVDSEQLAVDLDAQLRARNLQGAWQLVKDTHTYCIETAVVAAGLIALRNGAASAAEAMQSVKSRMRPALDANLSILATIGSNAPFVGLLGTVLGIINAAHELTGDGGQNNPNAVMSGVFEALVATAVGLFVAIPAVVAYNLYQRRVRKRLAEVDSLAHLILSMARADARSAAQGTTASPARVG